MESLLESIEKKIISGERLDSSDAVSLFKSHDLLSVCRIANEAKKRRWQNRAYFVVNRQINPTNVCVLSCKFCDFASKRNGPNAFEMCLDEIINLCNLEIREVHITSALHPDWRWSYYVEMIRKIKEAYPQVKIKAFTAVELDYFSRKFHIEMDEVLTELKSAGLDALPGGGAEVFSERIRKELFPYKIGSSEWLSIHRKAHQLGIPTNATLLYGHIETYEERVEHLMLLRKLQDETNGFMSFIPLAYQVGKTKIVARQASAIEDLKTIAVSRLVLDNFPHIKAYWVTMGEEIASIALSAGADDLDGTIGHERIMHSARAGSPIKQTRERLIELIRFAGCVAVERDGLYDTIKVYEKEEKLPVGSLMQSSK